MEFQYEDHRIFLENEQKQVLAEITFPMVGDHVNIDHTFVDASLQGQGIASQLMDAAIAYLHEKGWKFTATCSYAAAWLQKHPEANEEHIA